MLPWCKMNDEELEAVVGGVTPNLLIGKPPVLPITGDPGKGETPEFLIFF